MRISDWSSDVCSSDLFMGAEMIVKKYGLTKDDLDAYALESHRRGKAATEAGHFQREIVGVEIDTPDGRQTHLVDEGIRFDATLEGIAGVKILQEGGSITAATSSQICDGASAALVVSEQALKDHRSEEHTSELQSLMRNS